MEYLITSVLTTVMIALGFIIAPSAEAAAQEFKIPFNQLMQGVIGCPTSEGVQFSGTLQLVSNTILDGTGGFHLNVQVNVVGTGIGQTTGDKYIISGTHTVSLNVHGANAFTLRQTLTLIDTTSQARNSLEFIIHLTVNPDGTVTVDTGHFDFHVTCG